MRTLLASVLVLLSLASRAHATSEICGNDVDDDGNGMTDEGCTPTLTTGVCESPLSCGDTGMISWKTGALHYDLPPDVVPTVPYGPGIGLRRFYTSMYAPGTGPASVNHNPMGARWQHTYMSWIDRFQVGGVYHLVLHTSEGQDIYATYSTTTSGWEYYTPQAGSHVMSIKYNTASPNQYQVQLLTGETLYFNSYGQLTQIWNNLPTPNKVLVTWTSTSGGNVSTVTDASGMRRLNFNYTSNLLTSVQYQVKVSGTWTTEQTTSYAYTSGVLMSATIDGSLVQQYTYTSSYLSNISDGDGNRIAAFTYDGTNAGQVDRVDTARGTVGMEFNSTRTGCTGDTVLYFNTQGASCSSDSDCTGTYKGVCGGKTGSGSTGQCFQAGRCMGLSTVNGESVVTNVSPIGYEGRCTGACTDVAQYVWSGTSGLLSVTGTEDPLGYYTSATYNANGLPTQIAFGDSDDDPTDGGYSRTEYLYYDTTYPGRLAEVRRKSDLDPNASSCSASNTTGCARTLYTYGSDTTLYQIQQVGTTLNSTGSTTGYTYTTTFTHDSYGRLTEVDGPVSGAKTTYSYWSTSDIKNGFLQHKKVYTDATDYLDTQIIAYDTWGNATGRMDPDGTVTCRTYDTGRNYLTQLREAMAGQTDCTTTNSADLVTGYARDSALRLTQVTRPDGSCLLNKYDSSGRLFQTKRRDDCSSSSSGDTEEYVYGPDGELTELDTYDSASKLTRTQPYSYYNSRRVQNIVNPADTSYATNLSYDDRGLVTEVLGPGGLSETTYVIDADRRVTTENRYKTSTTYDSWSLLWDWLADQLSVTDGDSQTTQTTRDDLGRIVKITTPDMSYPTARVYDASGGMVTEVEALGGGTGVQKTNTFTFDLAERPLNDDYDGACPTGTPHPEIQRVYDTPPSCPLGGGSGCTRTTGRLAYVQVSLMCSSTYSATDGSLDQQTYYAYDDAGRMLHEYITDDSGRAADNVSAWTANSALAQYTAPSGTVLGWSYGSSSNNSDTDLVTSVWETSSANPVVDTVTSYPFGPLASYNQEDSIGGSKLHMALYRDAAYRIGNVQLTAGTTQEAGVAITRDVKGRVSVRSYFNSGEQPSYFTYDNQDRILCETTSSVSSCPAGNSAGNVKLTRPTALTFKESGVSADPFSPSGNWNLLVRPNPSATSVNLDDEFIHTAGHQINSDFQGTTVHGTTVFNYNALGNRISDTNAHWNMTHSERDYTYDGRHNVTNVRGQYPYWTCRFGCTLSWRYYDVGMAYDAQGRRVFKSFYDETTLKTSVNYYYYDALGRVSELRYTPDASTPGTYSTYQWFWLGDRVIMTQQTDYPAGTVTKRYNVTDETSRPIEMWSWPSSGDATQVWAINPTAWGWDTVLTGSGIYQPFIFPGQMYDFETHTYVDDGSTIHEPGMAVNGFRMYDPFVGGYLQLDPLADQTWSPYVYAYSNPVGIADALGLDRSESQFNPAGNKNTCNPPPSGNTNNGSSTTVTGGSYSEGTQGTPGTAATPETPQVPAIPGDPGGLDLDTNINWGLLDGWAQFNQCTSNVPTTTGPHSPDSPPPTFLGDGTPLSQLCGPAPSYDADSCSSCLEYCVDKYSDAKSGGGDCYTEWCTPKVIGEINSCKESTCEHGQPPFGNSCARECRGVSNVRNTSVGPAAL